MGERIPHEVDAAALPGRTEDLRDGGLQALVGVRDDELHAPQPSAGELAQERRPEGLSLGGTDVEAQHLAPAVAVGPDRHDHGDRDHAAILTYLQVGRVDPEIRPVALDRPLEEGLHPTVDLLTEPAHLALGDPGAAHGLDQVVDGAGRDPLDVGLLDHGGQRLLGHAPRLQEAREVGAPPELGDAQLDSAGAGLPVTLPVAVTLSQALGALLAIRGAGQAADFQLHQALGGEADHLAQQVRVRALLQQPAQVHHLVGHRWVLDQVGGRNPTVFREPSMTTAKLTACYSAMEGAQAVTFATVELHHNKGHDPTGGIADARGIAAAFASGGSACRSGTAYLFCPEATITPFHFGRHQVG